MNMIKIQKENLKRKSKYSKNIEEELFLKDMNIVLQKEEKYKDYSIKYPFIFIFGVPRSGTTLLSQLIAKHLEVGYFNNLSSKFWLSPLHGLRLSNSVIGNNNKIGYYSDFGRTMKLQEPHEFGYFWQHWLKMKKDEDFFIPGINNEKIEWFKLKKVLANIQHEFCLPVLMKNFFGINYFHQINDLSEKIVWVYIKRDLEDSAVSIYNARKNYYDNLLEWWSTKPPQYRELKDKNVYEQIAGQVFYLRKYYDNLEKQNPKRIIGIEYKELCKNPNLVFEEIISSISDITGYEMKVKLEIPSNFLYSAHENDERYSKFKKEIKKLI
jgi:LPS sulfotransferase NodH